MLLSLVIGFLAGIFGGIAGVGGGAVMIPMMVGILKLSQHKASGTSLMTLVFTGIAGTITYAAGGHVDFMAALLLAVTAIAGASWGARFSHSLPEATLRRYYGAFLIFIALSMVLKPWLPHVSSPLEGWLKVFVLLAAGFFTGLQSGIMGGGGGAVSIPAMVLLAGFSQHLAQGTSLLVMIPTGATAAWTYWNRGNVDKELLKGMIPGILIGTYAGATIAGHLPDANLRYIFALMLFWIGVRYLRTPPPSAAQKMSGD
ncbi:MAG TPA: sulfite exporter TauE/SafE family protein [Syntrophales bacterium]|nr:sulfite exporter TauE/SafE family protein [Syntrophales bacterium]